VSRPRAVDRRDIKAPRCVSTRGVRSFTGLIKGSEVKSIRSLPVFALLAWAVASCNEVTGPSLAPELITELPRSLSQAELALIEADNVFALKLFREIDAQSAPDSNIFVSPLSVSMALSMTYNGAAGETRLAMGRALEVQDLRLDEVNQGYRDLIDLLFNLDSQIEWQSGNSIWYRDGFFVEPSFLDVNRTFFDAQVDALDFGAPGAARIINQWVSESTNGRIDEIVAEPIDGDMMMFLINAIYFKGSWRNQFDRSLTRDAPFRLDDGTVITTPMMSRQEVMEVRRGGGELVSVLELPYGGDAFTMTVVLPRLDVSLDSVIEVLDADRWASWISGLRDGESFVELPRFSFEYEIELKDVLTAQGMGIAFGDGAADFTGIHPPGGLFISEVKHKTFIQVDEEGTEAAAVTQVGATLTSGPGLFAANRPFLFAIRERLSGTILFMGKMVDPTR
jgi:serine protease inhibitor